MQRELAEKLDGLASNIEYENCPNPKNNAENDCYMCKVVGCDVGRIVKLLRDIVPVSRKVTTANSQDVSQWARENGFVVSDTGGGCKALEYMIDEDYDTYMYITKKGDPSAPESLTEPITLGFYCDCGGDSHCHMIDIDEGLAKIRKIIL